MKLNDKIALWIVIIVIACVLARLSTAATKQIRVTTFTPAEQVTLIQSEEGLPIDSIISISGTASDSSGGDSINFLFTITYDSTKYNSWDAYILYKNETEVISESKGDFFPPVTAATAIISLADKQEIAGLANDSVTIHHGPGAYDSSSLGAGEFSITFFTIDTSAAPDDSLSGIPVFITNLTGAKVTEGITESNGAVTLKLNTGTWNVAAATNVTSWAFDDTTITVTGIDTFSILGYATSAPIPSAPTQGPIWGDIFAIIGGGPQSDVIVELRFATTTNVTASGVGVTYGSVIGFDTTDAAGRFSFDVPISVSLDDTTLYKVTGKFERRQTFSIDSLFNPVGGVNITDSIAAR